MPTPLSEKNKVVTGLAVKILIMHEALTMSQNSTCEYEERAVCFIDILGFKALVQRSESDQYYRDLIGKLVDTAIDEAKASKAWSLFPGEIPAEQKFGAEVVHFSDCLVLSVSSMDFWGLAWLFDTITAIGEKLIWEGVAIRGGATIGKLYHKEDKIFGPAMVEAYEMESKIAQVPRIIVSERLRDTINNLSSDEKWSLFDSKLSWNPDYWIIDYIRKNTTVMLYGPKFVNYIDRLRMLISQGLQSIDPSVLGKYEWLRRQYNALLADIRAVQQKGEITERDILEKVEIVSSWPVIV